LKTLYAHIYYDIAVAGRGNAPGCTCVVHRVFSGLLESNVTCMGCGNVTSTFDPFFDISLDFRKDILKGSRPNVAHSLVECLKRYTLPEKLASDSYTCSSCKKNQASFNSTLNHL
jgi:ubiquitin carboxyl-terminal hydrolase 22/27/51